MPRWLTIPLFLSLCFHNLMAQDSLLQSRYADDEFKGCTSVKLNILSPVLGHTELAVEHYFSRYGSFEIALSIIGLGRNLEMKYNYIDGGGQQEGVFKRNQGGIAMGFGYKRTWPVTMRGRYGSANRSGVFLRPMVYLGRYNEQDVLDYSTYPSTVNRTIQFIAPMMEAGVHLGDHGSFMLEFYIGGGVVFDNVPDFQEPGWGVGNIRKGISHYIVLRTADSSPGFGMSGGIRIGLMGGGKQLD